MELPITLRNQIEQRAAAYGTKQLTAAAQALSLRYRQESGQGKRLVQEPVQTLAYAIVRMPATYGAVYKALAQTLCCHSGDIRSVLDVGAGTGAAAWAVQAQLPTYAEYTCIEREPAMVQLGRSLMATQEELCDADWLLQDMTAGLAGKGADLVVASYALNELSAQARAQAVLTLWDATAQVLLLVEPGTPEGARQLNLARMQLLAAGAHLLAPCPHERPCPMGEGDWCHFTVRVARTRLHKQLKGGEVPYEDEKFCFLAVSKQAGQPAAGRILRHPQIQAGRVGLTVCEADGCIRDRLVTKGQKALFQQARKGESGDAFPRLC